MAFPASTNVDGSNPGPNSTTLPDTVQMPVGNIWKNGIFNITLSPTSVAPNTVAEQTFANTGIGLLTTDQVSVSKPTTQAGLGIVNCRVSAADTLAVAFINATAATNPAGVIAASRAAAPPVILSVGCPDGRFTTPRSAKNTPRRNPVPSALAAASLAAKRLA